MVYYRLCLTSWLPFSLFSLKQKKAEALIKQRLLPS
jgi:hypothetical protein